MKHTIRRPELIYCEEDGNTYRPSWQRPAAYLTEEHSKIHEITAAIPGWAAPEDAEKLYETAYYNGAVILEIGVYGGRSAVTELRGVRANPDNPPAQFYGLDIDPGFIDRAMPHLQAAGVDQRTFLYHGNLEQFRSQFSIVPTMVFVDGDHHYEGVFKDLQLLSTFLAPGTPVICHDFDLADVRKAVEEWVASGYFQFCGRFAVSVLLMTSDRCTGRVSSLSEDVFQMSRQSLVNRYTNGVGQYVLSGMHTRL